MAPIQPGTFVCRSVAVNNFRVTPDNASREKRLTMNTGVGAVNANNEFPRNSQSWKRLYEAAILETNLDAISGRIAEARAAVTNRLSLLLQDSGTWEAEKEALANALVVLEDLQRMYVSDVHSATQFSKNSGSPHVDRS